MTDEEVNDFANRTDILYIIEHRMTDDPDRLKHRCTTNFDQAKSIAKDYASNPGKYRKVLLHRAVIEETLEPIASVEFQKKDQDNAESTTA